MKFLIQYRILLSHKDTFKIKRFIKDLSIPKNLFNNCRTIKWSIRVNFHNSNKSTKDTVIELVEYLKILYIILLHYRKSRQTNFSDHKLIHTLYKFKILIKISINISQISSLNLYQYSKTFRQELLESLMNYMNIP